MASIGRNQRRATRLVFLVAGLGMAAWAPLVPYAKTRVGVDEGSLGLLLLCLGIGSIMAMPLTGVLAARFGCRSVILLSGALVCVVLPGLAAAPGVVELGAALFVFGAAIGTLDVAMNIQAVIVEKAGGGNLMSGFHALFSVGGILGAGGMVVLLGLGLGPLAACLILAAVLALLLLAANGHLLRDPDRAEEGAPLLVLPRGAVAFIGLLCFLVFLAEGAVLDWSALFLTTERGVDSAQAGFGYAAFALAMTVGRLAGDRVVRRLGGGTVLLFGGLIAAAGFFLAVLVPSTSAALLGFVLIGLGASNIVPVLFTAAGRQTAMPASLAVAAVTTLGYAGILAGPAVVGFAADATSLGVAFAGLGTTLLIVAAGARVGGRTA